MRCIMKCWWKCIALPGVVVANQPLCQFKPESLKNVLPDGTSSAWLKVFQESKSIHSGTVQEKAEDVSVVEREQR